jgi:hypothetical protein
VNTTYTLSPPDNSKRIIVRDKNGNWIDTEPIVLNGTSLNSRVYEGLVEPTIVGDSAPLVPKISENQTNASNVDHNTKTIWKVKRLKRLTAKSQKMKRALKFIMNEIHKLKKDGTPDKRKPIGKK